MRIAHNCSRCGSDLSRRRAPPDPHYLLPVVVCPRCTAACVRTRPEAVVLWRDASHLFYAWSRLAIQLGLVALFLNANAASARGLSRFSIQWAGAMPAYNWIAIAMSLSTAVCCGLWLGSCFPHWKRTTLLLSWTLLLLLIPVVASISQAADSFAGNSWRHPFYSLREVALAFWQGFEHAFDDRAAANVALVGLALLEALLTPLGRGPVALNRVLVRTKNRRRRRMLRGSRGTR